MEVHKNPKMTGKPHSEQAHPKLWGHETTTLKQSKNPRVSVEGHPTLARCHPWEVFPPPQPHCPSARRCPASGEGKRLSICPRCTPKSCPRFLCTAYELMGPRPPVFQLRWGRTCNRPTSQDPDTWPVSLPQPRLQLTPPP